MAYSWEGPAKGWRSLAKRFAFMTCQPKNAKLSLDPAHENTINFVVSSLIKEGGHLYPKLSLLRYLRVGASAFLFQNCVLVHS